MSNDDNNEAMKALLIDKVVRRAKEKDGGRTSCPSISWSSYADPAVYGFLLANPEHDPFKNESVVEFLATIVLSSVRKAFKSSKSFIVPDVCPISASGIEKGENSSHKRKYEETTMSKSDGFGAFVSVKSYTQFCLYMTSSLDLKEKSLQIVRQPIEALFAWVNEKTGIQSASKVRSEEGLKLHLLGKIAAALICMGAI